MPGLQVVLEDPTSRDRGQQRVQRDLCKIVVLSLVLSLCFNMVNQDPDLAFDRRRRLYDVAELTTHTLDAEDCLWRQMQDDLLDELGRVEDDLVHDGGGHAASHASGDWRLSCRVSAWFVVLFTASASNFLRVDVDIGLTYLLRCSSAVASFAFLGRHVCGVQSLHKFSQRVERNKVR